MGDCIRDLRTSELDRLHLPIAIENDLPYLGVASGLNLGRTQRTHGYVQHLGDSRIPLALGTVTGSAALFEDSLARLAVAGRHRQAGTGR